MSAKLGVDPAFRRGGRALDQERALAAHRFIQFFDRRIRAPYLRTDGRPSSGASWQVLFALGSKQEFTATMIAQELRIDRGYLSRILNAFQEQAIIAGISSKTDGRVHQLRLTAKGRKMIESIQRGRDRRLRTIFGGLSVEDAQAVIAAMRRIELIFGNQEKGSEGA
jgi:DNA-binding MarR family transcriptional regulator